jgi:hypothetical protein
VGNLPGASFVQAKGWRLYNLDSMVKLYKVINDQVSEAHQNAG